MKISLKQLRQIIKESISQTQSLLKEDMTMRNPGGSGPVILDMEFDILVPYSGRLRPGSDVMRFVRLESKIPVLRAKVIEIDADGQQNRYGVTPLVRFTFSSEEDKLAFIDEYNGKRQYRLLKK
jgi:hypothetical protein